MPHPSHTDLYSTLDPCAINHHQGKERRGQRGEEVHRRGKGRWVEGEQSQRRDKRVIEMSFGGGVSTLNVK